MSDYIHWITLLNMDVNSVVPLAASMLEESGIGETLRSADALSGGGNNRTFKINCETRSFLLKNYFQDVKETRSRMESDFGFCRFVWNCCGRVVPEPIALNTLKQAAIFEFVEGRCITPPEITQQLLDQAIRFFSEINEHRLDPRARELPDAAEACFSIFEHNACVDRRVRRLAAIDKTKPLGEQATRFVQQDLVPKWQQISQEIANTTEAAGFSGNLAEADRCISPSDFGFHNAILQAEGKVRFFDFEYAGWDDPAKMICDFFCQPAIPIPMAFFRDFGNGALAGFTTRETAVRRALFLLPAYRIKWCCIMLNDFLPEASLRRRFALGEADESARLKKQLIKAKQMLRIISDF